MWRTQTILPFLFPLSLSFSLSPTWICAPRHYHTGFLNKTRVHNKDILYQAVEAKRLHNVPLLTVSNHHSCFDDPGIWGEFFDRIYYEYKKKRIMTWAFPFWFHNLFWHGANPLFFLFLFFLLICFFFWSANFCGSPFNSRSLATQARLQSQRHSVVTGCPWHLFYQQTPFDVLYVR